MLHTAVYTTERGLFHQQRALAAAPPELAVTMLRQPDRETLRTALAEAEYLISERVGVIDADLLASAPKLKMILRLGSLAYDIDTQAAKARGIIVCRYPDKSTIAVAEHCVLQMLALGKRLREAERIALEARTDWRESKHTDEDTFAYNWSGREGIDRLFDRTVGIVGFGEIGAELARRLSTWGSAVLYTKRRRLPENVEHELNISYVDTNTLLRESDYVVCLLPYLSDTINYLNSERIALLKRGAFVVSCGSGGTLDEAALANAIQRGMLGGVALDTYDLEPILPDNPLLALARDGANVLLTPHIAAGGGAAPAGGKDRASEYTNIVRHLAGEPVLYRIV